MQEDGLQCEIFAEGLRMIRTEKMDKSAGLGRAVGEKIQASWKEQAMSSVTSCYKRKGRKTVAGGSRGRQQGHVKHCLLAVEVGRGVFFSREDEEGKIEFAGTRVR